MGVKCLCPRVQTLRTLIARVCYDGERIGQVLDKTLHILSDSPVWQHRRLAAQLLALSGEHWRALNSTRIILDEYDSLDCVSAQVWKATPPR